MTRAYHKYTLMSHLYICVCVLLFYYIKIIYIQTNALYQYINYS